MKSISSLLLLTASFVAASDEGDMPIVLDSSNFYGNVLDRETNKVIGDKPWFIEFYSPRCPHCVHLAPTWDELYIRNKAKVTVARVDCTTTSGKSLCHEFDVHGYPTLLLFANDGQFYHKYNGHRTIAAFEFWLSEHEHQVIESGDTDQHHDDSVDKDAKPIIHEDLSEGSFMKRNFPMTNAIMTSFQATFLQ